MSARHSSGPPQRKKLSMNRTIRWTVESKGGKCLKKVLFTPICFALLIPSQLGAAQNSKQLWGI